MNFKHVTGIMVITVLLSLLTSTGCSPLFSIRVPANCTEEVEGARLINDFNYTILPYVAPISPKVHVESTDLLLLVEYFSTNIWGTRKQYCTIERRYYDPLLGPWAIVCFYDSKNNGTFDSIGFPGMIGQYNVNLPYRYERVNCNLLKGQPN